MMLVYVYTPSTPILFCRRFPGPESGREVESLVVESPAKDLKKDRESLSDTQDSEVTGQGENEVK